jgi:hypothetical protein
MYVKTLSFKAPTREAQLRPRTGSCQLWGMNAKRKSQR